MCTIVIATRVFEDAPLVVAANRDESLTRPAEGPALRRFGEGEAVLSPIDLQAGGSWVGLNRHGLFVGLTNRQTDNPDADRRSRGELVTRFLQARSVDEGREWGEGLEVGAYNPFHLTIVGRRDGYVVWNDEDARRSYDLDPGIHVLTERFAGQAAGPSARRGETTRPERVAELVAGWGTRAPEDDELQALLADHRGVGFEDLKVSLPQFGYGTRSALTLRLAAEKRASSFTWSDRPPSLGSFEDRSELLSALFS